jgi:hypothetical protein
MPASDPPLSERHGVPPRALAVKATLIVGLDPHWYHRQLGGKVAGLIARHRPHLFRQSR